MLCIQGNEEGAWVITETKCYNLNWCYLQLVWTPDAWMQLVSPLSSLELCGGPVKSVIELSKMTGWIAKGLQLANHDARLSVYWPVECCFIMCFFLIVQYNRHSLSHMYILMWLDWVLLPSSLLHQLLCSAGNCLHRQLKANRNDINQQH